MGEHQTYKAVNWRVAADRLTIGERVELKSLPGYWVKPRKYSVAGEAEIKAAQVRALAETRGEAMREVAGMMADPESDSAAMGLSREQRDQIAVAIMERATADIIGSLAERRARVLYGIAEHNFTGEPAEPTPEWVDELMEYADVFDEVLAIAWEKNRPLAPTTPQGSETSPTGNSTEPPSTTEQESSLTGATP